MIVVIVVAVILIDAIAVIVVFVKGIESGKIESGARVWCWRRKGQRRKRRPRSRTTPLKQPLARVQELEVG